MDKVSIYRKKSHVLFLASLVLLAFILFTPLSKNAYVLSIALRQGNSVEFAGNRVYLGLDYVYKKSEFVGGDIEFQRIKPSFSGLDEDHTIYGHLALERHIKDFENHCSFKPSDCEVRGNGNYKVATVRTDKSPFPKFSAYNAIFNDRCSIYFTQFGESHKTVDKDFFDMFFEENCN